MNIDLTKSIVYVTRDIERALGIQPGTKPGQRDGAGYFIVSNDTDHGREVAALHPEHVLLVANPSGALFDTHELLALPETQSFIAAAQADVLVFQNNARIERICAEKRLKLLNPSAATAKRVEEKISQVEWLGDDASLLPAHNVSLAKDVRFAGKKFVLQFNHAHTGEGTYVIDSEDALGALQEKFPNRECRITDFIDGPVFTVNAVVAENRVGTIIVGNPSYQITGLTPFTDLPFSTIGNDWDLPREPEYENAARAVIRLANTVGVRLARSGWLGLFGIDAVFDPASGSTYLLEINARQPASATFESKLQSIARSDANPEPTIFEAHVMALTGQRAEATIAPISGAQIVKRATTAKQSVDVAALKAKGLSVIEYDNVEHNKELFRIQSTAGIMEGHGTFNELGKSIASCIR